VTQIGLFKHSSYAVMARVHNDFAPIEGDNNTREITYN